MTISALKFDPTAVLDTTGESAITEWYRDPTGAFSAGIWYGAPGRFEVAYTEDEFCQILQGEIRLTDAAGAVQTFKSGDSFVIPSGFTGTWETVSAVRKFWVIHEPLKD